MAMLFSLALMLGAALLAFPGGAQAGTPATHYSIGDTVNFEFRTGTQFTNTGTNALSLTGSGGVAVTGSPFTMTETWDGGTSEWVYTYAWATGGEAADSYAVQITDSDSNPDAGSSVILGNPPNQIDFFLDPAYTVPTDIFKQGSTVYVQVRLAGPETAITTSNLQSWGGGIAATGSSIDQTGSVFRYNFAVDFDTPGIGRADWGTVYWQGTDTGTLLQRTIFNMDALLHNGITTGSDKWDSDWGVTGTSKYGQFSCDTCHERSTTNIKRVKTSIATPDGSNWDSTGAPTAPVTFTSAVDGSSHFGDDAAGGRTTSVRVCEACHSVTDYHRYDITGQPGGTGHSNNTDCVTCHQHRRGFGASCDACHGNPPPAMVSTKTTNAASAGAHVLHATTRNISCSVCHYNSVGQNVTHDDTGSITLGFVDLFGPGTYTGGDYDGGLTVAYDFSDIGTNVSSGGTNECSNIYCHGSTMAPNGGTDISPKWDDPLTADCGTCHGGDAANSPVRGSHAAHAGSAGLALPCADCHNGLVPAGIPSGLTTHVDNAADISLDTGKAYIGGSATYDGTSVVIDDPYGKCSNLYCHDPSTSGAQSPLWGGTLANAADCSDCHGGDAGTATGELEMSSGKHQAHIGNADPELASFDCGICHADTVTTGDNKTITGAAKHADAVKDVAYDALNSGAAAGTCNNLYCHSDGKGGYNNQDLASVWIGVGTLDCKGCHGDVGTSNHGEPDYVNAGAGLAAANSHAIHVSAASDCGVCHADTSTTGTDITGAKHIDGALDVVIDGGYDSDADGTNNYVNGVGNKNCSNVYCHDPSDSGAVSPKWGGTIANAADCSACHGSNDGTVTGQAEISSGKHQAHIGNADIELGSFDCGICHAATVTTGNDKLVTGAVNHADMIKDVSYDAALNPGAAANACNNLYCHSDGKGGYNNQVLATAWGGASTLGCNGCHGDGGSTYGEPDYASGLPGAADSNSHAAHVVGSANCGICHADTSTTGTDITGAEHIDGGIDVVIDGGYDSDADGTNNYDGTVSVKTCSNVYCHDPSYSGTVDSPSWGDTLPNSADCSDCHGSNDGTATGQLEMSTGKHQAHIGNADIELGSFDCGVCHADTVTTGNDKLLTGASHSNSSKDVAYDALNSGATADTCNNLYCHSDGKGGYNNQDLATVWAGAATLDCTGCHGDATSAFGEPDYASGLAGAADANSHAIHVSVVSDCGICHADTSTNGTDITGAKHIDGNIDVVIAAAYDSDADGTNNYDGTVGVKTCSNVSCHDPSGGGAVSPQWGGSTPNAADCSACHGSNDGTVTGQAEMTSDKHQAHIANADLELASFDCGVCHAATVTTGDDKTVTGAAQHVDATKDVAYDALNSGASADTCNNLYCHSDGKGGYNNQVLSTAWTGVGTLDCKGCHGDNGSSTFGEPDYASGAAGAANANSHGAHVSAASDCGICHLDTSTNGTDITGAKHIDGALDVVFAGAYDDGGAGYVTGVGNKNCSNTTCHGSSSVKWGFDFGTADTCTKCHGQQVATPTEAQKAPGGSGVDTNGDSLPTDPEVGAHQAHLTSASNYSSDIACSDCHQVPGGIDPSGADGHLDGGGADMTWSALSTNSGGLVPSYSLGACSNTYCHGNQMPGGSTSGAALSPSWAADSYLNGTYDNDCGQCHGFPPTDTSSHSAMTPGDGSGCNACHPHLNDGVDAAESGWAGGAFSDASLHINGSIDANSDCIGCHTAYPPTSGAHVKHFNHITTDRSIADGVPQGTGTLGDWSTANYPVCSVCHDMSNSANHQDTTDYLMGAPKASWSFDGGNPTYESAGQTCSNVSCHFTTTPDWQP